MATGSTHARTHAQKDAVKALRAEYDALARAIEAGDNLAIGKELERLDQAVTRLEIIEGINNT